MSNIVGFATARKTSRGELLAGWLDGGEIRVYDGTRPADADTAVSTQALLVTFELPNPSGTVTNGVFTGAEIPAALVAETGTAAWARAVDSSAATVFDCDVGLVSSDALLKLNSLSLAEGGYCSVLSFGLTER